MIIIIKSPPTEPRISCKALQITSFLALTTTYKLELCQIWCKLHTHVSSTKYYLHFTGKKTEAPGNISPAGAGAESLAGSALPRPQGLLGSTVLSVLCAQGCGRPLCSPCSESVLTGSYG